MSARDVLLQGLNPAQAEAVTTVDGPLLVLAGAGSGKTRVITRRIAWLVHQGVPSERILAVTFTNKAAREMLERVESLLGPCDATIRTFHSFGARLLRSEADRLGLSPSFSLYDRSDSESAVKAVLDDLNLDRSSHPPIALLEAISHWKSNLIAPPQAYEQAVGAREELHADVYAAYERMLEINGALDFDDLLCKTVALLRDDDDLRRAVNDNLQYVLVDEYQDVNRAQYLLARLLGDSHRNICVTGDPDQCIYSWRGADISYILDFTQDYEEAKTVVLDQNYRSVNTILEAASAVIRFNDQHGDKNLWSERGQGPPIEIRRVTDEIEEARAVTEHVLDLMSRGVRRSEIAVFYRVNSLSFPVERALVQAGIPYQVVAGLEFFKRKEVKDVMAWLRYMLNRHDSVSLTRIINVPTRGIGAKTVSALQETAKANECSLGYLLDDPELWEGVLAKRANTMVAKFTHLVKSLRTLDGTRASDFIRELVEATGYFDHLADVAAKTGADPRGNVEQLIAHAHEYDKATPGGGVMGFLEEISLLSDIDAYEAETEKVVMMTLHSAKGLEFPHVIIVGMDREIFPHRGVLRPPDEEEERRLFYVGLTRAMESLVLMTAQMRSRFGRLQVSAPSLFLQEVPEELTEVIDETASSSYGGGFDSHVEYELEDDFRIQRGARVYHKTFGTGTVQKVSGRGGDARVEVDFDDVGRKKLVLRYAGLESMD